MANNQDNRGSNLTQEDRKRGGEASKHNLQRGRQSQDKR